MMAQDHLSRMNARMGSIVSELRERAPSDVRPHALSATDDSASLLAAFIQHYSLEGVLEIVEIQGASRYSSPVDMLESILRIIESSHPAPETWPLIERAKQLVLSQIAADTLGGPGVE